MIMTPEQSLQPGRWCGYFPMWNCWSKRKPRARCSSWLQADYKEVQSPFSTEEYGKMFKRTWFLGQPVYHCQKDEKLNLGSVSKTIGIYTFPSWRGAGTPSGGFFHQVSQGSVDIKPELVLIRFITLRTGIHTNPVQILAQEVYRGMNRGQLVWRLSSMRGSGLNKMDR